MELDAATIERIYSGGLADQPWQAFVDSLCDQLDATIAALAFRTIRDDMPSIGVQGFRRDGRKLWDTFQAKYRDMDTFHYDKMEAGVIHALSDHAAEADMARLRAELHLPLGVGECYAMALYDGGEPVAYMIWLKAVDRPLTAEEAQWAQLVAAPLARAIGGYHRMRVAELSSRLAADALGRLEVGVIAIDDHARVLFSNDVADRLVARCPDMGMHAGRLVMTRPELAGQLLASRTAPQAVQVRSREGAMIGLMMAPVESGRDELGPGSRPERAIYLHEMARSAAIPEQLIAELFGLSRAEARLAALLCTGLTLREAAARMHITENSARTYSKLAFSKLGVSRQTELVRQILTSVAIFGSIRGD